MKVEYIRELGRCMDEQGFTDLTGIDIIDIGKFLHYWIEISKILESELNSSEKTRKAKQ